MQINAADLPTDPKLEQGIIGCTIYFPAECLVKLCLLQSAVFHDHPNRILAEVLKELAEENGPVDIESVAERLKKKGKLKAIGGTVYLQEILTNSLDPSDFDTSLAKLKALFLRRNTAIALTELLKRVLSPSDETDGAVFADVRHVLEGLTSDAKPPTDLKSEWVGHFIAATCSAEGLRSINVPPREKILGDFFSEGDLGFIYGARGCGKTWLGMYLARGCAEGRDVALWKVDKARRVLYVDGEMALDGIRERDQALTTSAAPGMFYLQHEALFHLTGKVLNLTNAAVQGALLEICLKTKVEMIFLDNLSCLFTGLKENDADAWELVLPWLLNMRRNRIAVVFIAHAGRNGFMRGTCRREDAADWMIKLSEAVDAGETQRGAKFVARFEKHRSSTGEQCPPIEWTFFKAKDEPLARVAWKKLSTLEVFRQWIEDGLTRATLIAEEMGLSKGQVSKMAKKGMIAGWLKKEKDDYVLVR